MNMKNKKGFTLVEILAIVVIIVIIMSAAGVGVLTIVQNQRKKLAYTAEVNISEAALSYYANKSGNYLKACTNSDKSFVTISQKSVEDLNKFLREEKFVGYTDENLYQSLKDYSINGNDDPTKKYELSSYIKVDNPSCYKTITVGELMEKGLISDSDGMCNKSSLIIIYRRTDAKNTAGIIDVVQETGICKSDYKTERGPVITITPFSDLSYSSSKEIKVNVTTESTKLKNSFTMQYGWSKNDRKKPSSWQNLVFTDNTEEKASASLTINDLDEVKYLWIKGGTELDNKKNKTSDMVAGPYAFLAAPWVTYDLNGGETGDCPEKKQVVYTREYGKNTQGINEYLCTPTRTGYDFAYWTYKDTDKKITNTSIVNDKTDHYLKANWSAETFVITLDKNGGTVAANPTSVKAPYGENYIIPDSITIPKKEYKVSGFGLAAARRSDGATVSSTDDIMCNYTFNGWYTANNGGEKLLSEGESPVLQPNISGYTDEFGNWQKNSPTTVYAKWGDDSITLPSITKTGFTCGWTTNSSGTTIEYDSEASISPTANTVMYGVCDSCGYSIVYNKNNVSAVNEMANSICSLDSNCTLRANAFTLSGYTFKGWTANPNGTGAFYNNRHVVNHLASDCNEQVNLYARWCANAPAVTHGTCTLQTTTNATCSYTTTCQTGYTRENDPSSVCDKCVPTRYTITYNYNGGTAPSSGVPSSYLYGTGARINGTPTRKGYTFLGWTGSNGSTASKDITISTTATGNKSYTANWSAISYNNTFNLNTFPIDWSYVYGNRFIVTNNDATSNFVAPTIKDKSIAELDAINNTRRGITFPSGHSPSYPNSHEYFDFNAKDKDYLTLGAINNLSNVSVEIVFSLDSYYAGSTLMGNAEGGGFSLGLGRGNKQSNGSYTYALNFCIGQRPFDASNRGEYDCVKGYANLTKNTKYHLVGTFHYNASNNNIKVYLNGVLKKSLKSKKPGTKITNPIDNAHVILGAEATKNGAAREDWFDGKIYSARLYNTVLSATDVLHNFMAENNRYVIKNDNQNERYRLAIRTIKDRTYTVYYTYGTRSTLKPTSGNSGLVIRAGANPGSGAVSSYLGSSTIPKTNTNGASQNASFSFKATGSTTYIYPDFSTLQKDDQSLNMYFGNIRIVTGVPYDAPILNYSPNPTKRSGVTPYGLHDGWTLNGTKITTSTKGTDSSRTFIAKWKTS